MLQEHDAQHFAECNKKAVKVLFDYEAQREDELQLVEGEEIIVLEQDDSGWWKGQSKDSKIGLFPANFTDATDFGTIRKFVEKYHYTLRHLLIGGAKKKEGAEKKIEAEKKTAKEAEKKKEEFRQKEEEKKVAEKKKEEAKKKKGFLSGLFGKK
jgi:hypothetical protein